MKIILSHNNLSDTIDFSRYKSINQIVQALKKIENNDSPFHVKVKDINLEFSEINHPLAKVIEDITRPDTSLYYLVTAISIIEKSDKELYNSLIYQNNNQKITDVVNIINHYCYYYSNRINHLHNPNYELFEPIKYKGIPCLFTDIRIDRTKLPKGVYCYETMHDDDGKGLISVISHHIHINFWGTVLTTNPIKLNNDYIDVNENNDIEFLSNCNILLRDYVAYQKIQNKTKESYMR